MEKISAISGRTHNAGTLRITTSIIRVLLLSALQFGPSLAISADTLDQTISIDIPEHTRLEDALIQWGIKAEMTVMFNTKIADRLLTGKVQGTLSAQKALVLILKDSGLSYTKDGQRILIVPTSSLQRTALP